MSKFHKVTSDEVWNLYQGEGVYLYTFDPSGTACQRHELSAAKNVFCHVVPAGVWQAAESIGHSVFVGCSVGPSFEFSDFELIESNSVLAKTMSSDNADLSKFMI